MKIREFNQSKVTQRVHVRAETRTWDYKASVLNWYPDFFDGTKSVKYFDHILSVWWRSLRLCWGNLFKSSWGLVYLEWEYEIHKPHFPRLLQTVTRLGFCWKQRKAWGTVWIPPHCESTPPPQDPQPLSQGVCATRPSDTQTQCLLRAQYCAANHPPDLLPCSWHPEAFPVHGAGQHLWTGDVAWL